MSALVALARDPLASAARQLLDHYQDSLPDLSACRLLVADTQCAPALRAALLAEAQTRGFSALLGPTIERLDSWLTAHTDIGRRIINRPAQELILGEALRAAKSLYTDTDPWLLADQLLQLFEDMTRYQVGIAASLEAFREQLQAGYGLSQAPPALHQEAYILHTLWHAWHQQLAAEQAIDPAGAYIERLQASLEGTFGEQLWLLGFTEFTPAESQWLKTCLARGQARLLLHGQAEHGGNHPDAPLNAIVSALQLETAADAGAAEDAYSAFFRTLFDTTGGTLRQRARRFAAHCPDDPLAGRLQTLNAADPEQEARAVALAVRRWLLAGLGPVAVVSEDRRLARRVRAMLEASGISLDDPAGWALSTTSAAALLERWLETVEEDFACGPLLDVLKSPFVSDEREEHLALVRRLERDIILHENIARGLDRYRRHLDLRRERLPQWSQDNHRALHALLNHIDHAAGALLPFLSGRHRPDKALAALIDSLRALGAWDTLAVDAAGQVVIQTLEQLAQAATGAEIRLSWQELRNWLGRNLERATFRVPGGNSAVKLLTLEQTRLQRFAAIVVAGCSAAHLPGTASGEAFFNQRVRSQLGLPTWQQRLTTRLHHFVRILHSGRQLLLTRHLEADAESVPPSPWLELLETFHANAYATDLEDRELAWLLGQPAAQPASPDTAIPPLQTRRPAPVLAPAQQPHSWSAYTHQRLIDCPYRFFAADALGLKPLEEIREALSKNDYGSLVHRVLQAFHSDLRGLAGPWRGSLGPAQRNAALALLRQISEQVFAAAVSDDFQARGWLQQWLDCLPDYIDWQIERAQHWQLERVEVKAERELSEHLKLKGRIDRIDRHETAAAIVDYKTGRPPDSDAVLTGEAVQLPSYALLAERDVQQLDYLEIARAQVRATTVAAEPEVGTLIEAVRSRLLELHRAMRAGAPLPAWGDERTCGYCEFDGLCRRDAWTGDGPYDD